MPNIYPQAQRLNFTALDQSVLSLSLSSIFLYLQGKPPIAKKPTVNADMLIPKSKMPQPAPAQALEVSPSH